MPSSALLDERRRLAYLRALDIVSYVPRQALALAPPPREIPEEIQEQSPIDAGPASSPVAEVVAALSTQSHSPIDTAESEVRQEAGGRDGLGESVDPRPQSSPAAAKPSAAAQSPAADEPAADEPALQFDLRFWRISDEVLVADDSAPSAAMPVEALLFNILRACDYRAAALPRSDNFHWPLRGKARIGSGASAARESLQAFLQAKECPKLLLFGESTAPLFEDGPVEMLVLPFNLVDLLQNPGGKRQTWQRLQDSGFRFL